MFTACQFTLITDLYSIVEMTVKRLITLDSNCVFLFSLKEIESTLSIDGTEPNLNLNVPSKSFNKFQPALAVTSH